MLSDPQQLKQIRSYDDLDLWSPFSICGKMLYVPGPTGHTARGVIEGCGINV